MIAAATALSRVCLRRSRLERVTFLARRHPMSMKLMSTLTTTLIVGALIVAAMPASASPKDDQIERGKSLYGVNCAKCHGDSGEGKKAPALVGKTALPLD